MDGTAQKHLRARRELLLGQLSPAGRALVESAPPLTQEQRAIIVGALKAAQSRQRAA